MCDLQSNHPPFQIDQRCPDIPRSEQSIVPNGGAKPGPAFIGFDNVIAEWGWQPIRILRATTQLNAHRHFDTITFNGDLNTIANAEASQSITKGRTDFRFIDADDDISGSQSRSPGCGHLEEHEKW